MLIRVLIRVLIVAFVILTTYRCVSVQVSQHDAAVAAYGTPSESGTSYRLSSISCERLDEDPATPLYIELRMKHEGPYLGPYRALLTIEFLDEMGVLQNYTFEEPRMLDGYQLLRHPVAAQAEWCRASFRTLEGEPLDLGASVTAEILQRPRPTSW